ncbi:MAG TPA: aminotransferase class IV, partial [Caulobacteraceae bacterium]
MIETDDRGLLLGDGLFETVLWLEGLIDFAAHARRLQRGCGVIGLPAPETEVLESAAIVAVRAAGLEGERAAVRLTWTAGSGGRGLDRPDPVTPRLIASAAPSPVPAEPARLLTSDIARNDRSPASRLKTLAYLDNVLAR